MFRVSSCTLLSGNNITFTINYNTTPGEEIYIIGSDPLLGNWDVKKARRLIWSKGFDWEIQIGFPTDVMIQYKYLIYNDNSKTYHWETIDNRQLFINENDMYIKDEWNVNNNNLVGNNHIESNIVIDNIHQIQLLDKPNNRISNQRSIPVKSDLRNSSDMKLIKTNPSISMEIPPNHIQLQQPTQQKHEFIQEKEYLYENHTTQKKHHIINDLTKCKC